MTSRRDWFAEFTSRSDEFVSLGDDRLCEVKGIGTVNVAMKLIDGQCLPGRLEKVLYVPDLKKNLFSIGVCTARKYEVHLIDDDLIMMKNNCVASQGVRQGNNLYRMLIRAVVGREANVASGGFLLWHERLGHVSGIALQNISRSGLVRGADIPRDIQFFCEACRLSKSHRLPIKKNCDSKSGCKPGEFLHATIYVDPCQ